jgi:catechol 2,3-dioxygenase-like lactoylglutathione lyase family enzyme
VELVDGVHHVTFLTEDLDRLLAFYVRVFDAEVTLDMTEEGPRHASLTVGPTTVLHPFQIDDQPSDVFHVWRAPPRCLPPHSDGQAPQVSSRAPRLRRPSRPRCGRRG